MSLVLVTALGAPLDPVELRSAADVLDEYRQHYGQAPAPARTRDWLVSQVERRLLTVFVARLEGATVGVATTFVAPATQLLGHVCFERVDGVVPLTLPLAG
jgi:hypothetical protein